MHIARSYGIGSALPRTQREGVSLLAALILVTSVAGLSVAALMMSNSAVKRQVSTRQQIGARLAADAGLAEAVTRLRIGGAGALPALAQPSEFGGGRYWVESVTDESGFTSLVANGEVGDANFRQELVVQMAPRSIYSFGAFGDEHLELASNAQVDSFDSDLGTYEELEVNGSGQSAWASENGTIGSNHDIVLRQNARTYGDALSGPRGDVTIMGNAFVTGAAARAGELMVLDPIEVPAGVSSGPLVVDGGTTTRVGPGTHVFDRGNVGVNGVLEITGPAQVVLESLAVGKNAQVEIDSSNGMVEIYVRHDFILSSNTQMGPRDLNAAGLALFLESDNIIDPGENVDLDEIDLESNSKLYGTIYAPNANVVINSNFELYGAVVARRLRLDSNSQVHYDERLVENRDEDVMTMNVIGWRVLPRRAGAENGAPAPVESPGDGGLGLIGSLGGILER